MTKYDASILQDFANRLYEKAGFITFQCVVLGALIGAGLAAIPAVIISNQQDQADVCRACGHIELFYPSEAG